MAKEWLRWLELDYGPEEGSSSERTIKSHVKFVSGMSYIIIRIRYSYRMRMIRCMYSTSQASDFSFSYRNLLLHVPKWVYGFTGCENRLWNTGRKFPTSTWQRLTHTPFPTVVLTSLIHGRNYSGLPERKNCPEKSTHPFRVVLRDARNPLFI